MVYTIPKWVVYGIVLPTLTKCSTNLWPQIWIHAFAIKNICVSPTLGI